MTPEIILLIFVVVFTIVQSISIIILLFLPILGVRRDILELFFLD